VLKKKDTGAALGDGGSAGAADDSAAGDYYISQG
jgi:hypothetical protein